MAEVGARCKYCGSDQPDWLRLDISRRNDGSTFRLYVTATGPGWAVSTFQASDTPTETWLICRFGHLTELERAHRTKSHEWHARLLRHLLYPAPDDVEVTESPNVVRLLGSTGGGKSQIVRALRQEVIPPPASRAPVELRGVGSLTVSRERGQEEGERLAPGLLPPTVDFKETVRRRLENFLADHSQGRVPSDDLSDVLAAALSLENRDPMWLEMAQSRWGDSRAPYLLISELQTRTATHRTVTSLMDLPGEVLDRLMGRGGRRLDAAERAQLEFSHHFVAVVDALGLTGLYRNLTEPERLGALHRHQASTRIGHEEAREQAMLLLNDILHMRRDVAAFGHARLTVALSKCDAVRRMLEKSPPATADSPLSRWGWMLARGGDAFVQSAADTLIQLSQGAANATSGAAELLKPLRLAGHQQAAAVATAIAQDILAAFGEPDAFWDVVAVGHGLGFEVAGTTVQLESQEAYWFNSIAGRTLQVRDVVCAVVVSALLGAEFGRNVVARLVEASHPRFVLTCTREYLSVGDSVLHADDPQARIGSDNAGILQLMAQLLQEPRDD